ncbi:assimilatory sulfite reductase (NADPH) flavoprotein subunit [Roseimarinus sediminis]|uniref:assimilatory sulfite reductase (NADPH) flavoprotein subunit n=1 Tax=Roseimarinus sediminis TaxID=1610899 RepID=UPI003D2452DE
MSNSLQPFTAQQQQELKELLHNATSSQLLWLSGYISGLSQKLNGRISETVGSHINNDSEQQTLTVLYGTHTGHSEQIAGQLATLARQQGIKVKLSSLDNYKVRDLNKEEQLALIVSTHGEGEPPLMAEALHDYVHSKKAKAPNLKYAVLALGDRSYQYFCKTGIDFNTAFGELGGKALLPLLKCDVDYEADAAKWIKQLLEKIETQKQKQPEKQTENSEKNTVSKYSKLNPFYAEVLDRRKITGRNSDKEVWHIELSLEGSGLHYEPGDAIGVFTNNPPELVDQLIEHTGFNPNSTVTTRYDDVTLYEALYHHFEITVLNRKVLEDYLALGENKKLEQLLSDSEALESYLDGSDLLDLLSDFPIGLKPAQLISVLRYLPPRLYSIASSLEANPDEVHFAVAKVDFERNSRKRKGACSSYISERLRENEKIPVFIEKNINFRLPQGEQTPLIMIGAGTGVAPYRAFMQELQNRGRKNNSWLIFGERTFSNDFLYQVEWQKFVSDGVLGHIDLAFSRDQQQKVYVQHKLQEKSSEIYGWLQKGAHLYICGDRKKMFNDVHSSLLEIIKTQGGISHEKAEAYLHQLKHEKRYQLDVY